MTDSTAGIYIARIYTDSFFTGFTRLMADTYKRTPTGGIAVGAVAVYRAATDAVYGSAQNGGTAAGALGGVAKVSDGALKRAAIRVAQFANNRAYVDILEQSAGLIA